MSASVVGTLRSVPSEIVRSAYQDHSNGAYHRRGPGAESWRPADRWRLREITVSTAPQASA